MCDLFIVIIYFFLLFSIFRYFFHVQSYTLKETPQRMDQKQKKKKKKRKIQFTHFQTCTSAFLDVNICSDVANIIYNYIFCPFSRKPICLATTQLFELQSSTTIQGFAFDPKAGNSSFFVEENTNKSILYMFQDQNLWKIEKDKDEHKKSFKSKLFTRANFKEEVDLIEHFPIIYQNSLYILNDYFDSDNKDSKIEFTIYQEIESGLAPKIQRIQKQMADFEEVSNRVLINAIDKHYIYVQTGNYIIYLYQNAPPWAKVSKIDVKNFGKNYRALYLQCVTTNEQEFIYLYLSTEKEKEIMFVISKFIPHIVVRKWVINKRAMDQFEHMYIFDDTLYLVYFGQIDIYGTIANSAKDLIQTLYGPFYQSQFQEMWLLDNELYVRVANCGDHYGADHSIWVYSR